MVGLLGGGGGGRRGCAIKSRLSYKRNSPSTTWLKRSDLNQTNISLNIILL